MRQQAVVVLTFHRVLGDTDFEKSLSLPGMKIRGNTFQKLIAYLESVCQMADPLTARPKAGNQRLPVVISFDDGWLDNVAALQSVPDYIHPVVFICPGLMDQQTPFWPEQVTQCSSSSEDIEALVESMKQMPEQVREVHLRRLAASPLLRDLVPIDRTMSWEQVIELEKRGVRFGSHTQTHKMVTGLTTQQLDLELRSSISEISARLGKGCTLLAYPNGSFSAGVFGVVGRHVPLAFTTQPGAWVPATDPLAIPRMNVCEEKLCGPFGRFSRVLVQYNLFWKCWRASNLCRQASGPLTIRVAVGAEH